MYFHKIEQNAARYIKQYNHCEHRKPLKLTKEYTHRLFL